MADERKNEILKCFEGSESAPVTRRIIDDMVFLESELDRLRGLPHILVSKDNPALQKQTAAARLYAAYLSRYSDIVNKLASALRREDAGEEESPLRAYFKNRKMETR